jgi:hypothetical protein
VSSDSPKEKSEMKPAQSENRSNNPIGRIYAAQAKERLAYHERLPVFEDLKKLEIFNQISSRRGFNIPEERMNLAHFIQENYYRYEKLEEVEIALLKYLPQFYFEFVNIRGVPGYKKSLRLIRIWMDKHGVDFQDAPPLTATNI